MKRIVFIYVLLSFILLALFTFMGVNVYYLVLEISSHLPISFKIFYCPYFIMWSTTFILGCCSIAANIITMVLLKKIPATKLAMDTEKEIRIKKLEAKKETCIKQFEAKIEGLKTDYKSDK